MLANGEIDVIFSASRPSSMDTSPNVKRLFDNFKEVEADYFKRTNIFPIMHVVALRREVYEANPWIAKTLTKAFKQALDMAYEPLRERSALRYMLPWLEEHVEETQALMGTIPNGGEMGSRRIGTLSTSFLSTTTNRGFQSVDLRQRRSLLRLLWKLLSCNYGQ
jgi:4,5-dihydroxyphthalate decarboxylase